MKLPDGWKDYDPCCSNPNRPVECGDCGWEGFENEVHETLWQVDGLLERVSPGEILPVGTCPAGRGDTACRAWVHYTDIIVAYRLAPNVLEQIVEATE